MSHRPAVMAHHPAAHFFGGTLFVCLAVAVIGCGKPPAVPENTESWDSYSGVLNSVSHHGATTEVVLGDEKGGEQHINFRSGSTTFIKGRKYSFEVGRENRTIRSVVVDQESIQLEKNPDDMILAGVVTGGTLYAPPQDAKQHINFDGKATIQITGVLKSFEKNTYQQGKNSAPINVFDLKFENGLSVFNVVNPYHYPIPVGRDIVLEYKVAHFQALGHLPCIHRLYVKPEPLIKEETDDESDLPQQHDGPSSSDD